MTVHLVKMAVGVEDAARLAVLQKARLERARRVDAGEAKLVHVTRSRPRREKELLDGGSVYWVINRFIRVRQKILGLDDARRNDGRPACAVVLAPLLISTRLFPFRPFRGWRYLETAKAPDDLVNGLEADNEGVPDVPPEMAAELRYLGLL